MGWKRSMDGGKSGGKFLLKDVDPMGGHFNGLGRIFT